MKKRLLFSILFLAPLFGMAQQIPLFSQYMYERNLYNPAYTGTVQGHLESALNIRRNQTFFSGDELNFAGLDQTFTNTTNFAVHAPFRRNNFALGFRFIQDRFFIPMQFLQGVGSGDSLATSSNAIGRRALYSTTTLSFSGAYQIQTEQGLLSLGMDLGTQFANLNQKSLRATDGWNDVANSHSGSTNDQALKSANEGALLPASTFIPDMGLGIYFDSPDRYYAGVSVAHVIPFRISRYADNKADQQARLFRHYFFMGGGNIKLSDDMTLKPSFMGRMTESFQGHVDLSAAIAYNKVELGASYRTNQTLVGFFRVNILKEAFLSYSYDHHIGDIQNAVGASHELMISYLIDMGEGARKIRYYPKYNY